MLKETFTELVIKYDAAPKVAMALWDEIEKAYTHKKRHYHTLLHLENLIIELSEYRSLIKDWDILLFSVFYHDIIYNVLKNNNEEESAMLAMNRLKSIGFPEDQIEKCRKQILATKNHEMSQNMDTDLFIDADLSVLGKDCDTYSAYAANVRKEYALYPDFAYNPGRKKVLTHFLEMGKIFKTEVFQNKYEFSARENMAKEMNDL